MSGKSETSHELQQAKARRVLICRPPHAGADGFPAALTATDHAGFLPVVAERSEALLESVVRNPPDVLVFELALEPEADLAFLRLIRRLYPDLPLVVLGDGGSLGVRRSVQSLRPIYFGVTPVDEHELEDAVSAALRRRVGQA